MRTFLTLAGTFLPALGSVIPQIPIGTSSLPATNANISVELFNDLEELSRLVDISYCVGLMGVGIQKPFQCASRCSDFENFELVTTWNTGQMMSDSCGYIALSHPPSAPRIIVAFRGTYSVANTIIDLSTVPQEYVPYPGDEAGGSVETTTKLSKRDIDPLKAECTDCTVHMGFMRSWQHTRPSVLPQVEQLKQLYPDYQLTLVGHSLGGAVAALASLEFQARGWDPQVTTFGEPRIGNQGLTEYFDKTFAGAGDLGGRYRRVTHIDDPVPLLPLTEWGYTPHAGEVYISKPDLSPEAQDVHYCSGDTDPGCIAGADVEGKTLTAPTIEQEADLESFKDWWNESKDALSVPARWRIWQLFFAHRDYFWRLGLCIPGGDPKDWYRKYPHDDVGESPEL